MNRRLIPNTALEVSPICLGTMTFGTPVDQAASARIVQFALDNGINFIDTANSYEGYARVLGSSGGVAETCLARALEGRREQAVVATKVGHPIGPDEGDKGLSVEHILRECDRSLSRLSSEWIDIYYMHHPYQGTPIEESISAMMALIQAGKIRYWAVSNFDAEQTRGVIQACDSEGFQRPVVHQPAYSLLKRDIEEDLLPLCVEQQIGVVPYQVLQGGMLTGKYTSAEVPPPGSRATEKPEWIPLLKEQSALDEVAELNREATEQGLSLYDYTIRTTLGKPGITSIIIGVKEIPQIETAINALE